MWTSRLNNSNKDIRYIQIHLTVNFIKYEIYILMFHQVKLFFQANCDNMSVRHQVIRVISSVFL